MSVDEVASGDVGPDAETAEVSADTGPMDDISAPADAGVVPTEDAPTVEETTPSCEDQCQAGAYGCQGSLLWSCEPGVSGCLIPGVEEDCAAKGQQCVLPGECQDPGTDPAPPGSGLICSQFDQCMVDQCGNPPSEACANTAFNSVCVPAAANMTEVNLYLALNGCKATNCLSSPNIAAQAECITTHCLSAYAQCFAGTYGDGACGGIDGCVSAEGCTPSPDEVDLVCARDCYNQASEPANAVYWSLQLCIYGACGNDENLAACALSAVQEDGACLDLQELCQNDGAP